MGISIMYEEARALRDAIRTDYAAREEAAANGDVEQRERLRVLDDADNVLRSVFMYDEELEGEERKANANVTYYRITLDVPATHEDGNPGEWLWENVIDTTHPVYVVDSQKVDA
jgi:hypothetical protein